MQIRVEAVEVQEEGRKQRSQVEAKEPVAVVRGVRRARERRLKGCMISG